MSVYDVNGIELNNIYDVNGNELMDVYDINGNPLYLSQTYPYLNNRICVFDEQFNGNALSTNRWVYEIGYCRNNELQHYRPENVIIGNGRANIKAIREHYVGDTIRNSAWTSGSIRTKGKFEAFYGRWQARIKFPKIKGSFGAFWLLGGGCDFVYTDDGNRATSPYATVPWSECGELDIEETIPGDAEVAKCNIWNYTTDTSGGQHTSNAIDISKWHIYEIEWTDQSIQMMVDGIVYNTYDLSVEELKAYKLATNPKQNGFYIIINHAIGASGGTPPENTNEMDMLVDFVRVYAPESYTQDMIYADSIGIGEAFTLQIGERKIIEVEWDPLLTFDRTISWSSSNTDVATVNNGCVTAVSAGIAVITATTNNGKTAQCTVTVS